MDALDVRGHTERPRRTGLTIGAAEGGCTAVLAHAARPRHLGPLNSLGSRRRADRLAARQTDELRGNSRQFMSFHLAACYSKVCRQIDEAQR